MTNRKTFYRRKLIENSTTGSSEQRRSFLKGLAATTISTPIFSSARPALSSQTTESNENYVRQELDINHHWEGLNTGYWRNQGKALRRQIENFGDRARRTGFPYHYESYSHLENEMPTEYDPSLPLGIMWNRNWKLKPPYKIRVEGQVLALTKPLRPDDDPDWKVYQSGYGLLGVALGGDTQFESFHPSIGASPFFAIRENGEYGIMRHTSDELDFVTPEASGRVASLSKGDKIIIELDVTGRSVVASITINNSLAPPVHWAPEPDMVSGYFGLAARGLLDTKVKSVALATNQAEALHSPLNECHVCYPLGDTLKKEGKNWQVRFVSLFRSSGKQAEIRVSPSSSPSEGWENVPACGQAGIVSNNFRINTSIIEVRLPANPAEQTMYYTVWKDGVNVTSDPRLGTDSVGPGTGLVGDVPGNGNYVGRLPQLQAPYRIAGLSCHAIHTASKAELPDAESSECNSVGGRHCDIHMPFYVHDQPCEGAFKYLEQYDFQVMLWEDDVWYLELLLFPPSTEDAYKIITETIAGPTSRWQMMRHWNVLNPGDHDHGMDDTKGPEQLLLRNRTDLGQDMDYMVRNFQIVSHLMTGKENPSGKDNPKRWRKWKFPNRDFSLLIMDSRLWRTSQDTAIWDDEGWGHSKELYSRLDPTRTLLGEEQFSWLSQQLRTDSSPLICLTGINVLHTIWGGRDSNGKADKIFERDRVSADYAGWVKAGADRIIELLSNRSGVVSVYGDVHIGSIIENKEKRLVECSFGPIGRWGSRALINGFGRKMKDADGRAVNVYALYHAQFKDVDLTPQDSINYWNFLEAHFDPGAKKNNIKMRIRNIIDAPSEKPRGGGEVSVSIGKTGAPITAAFPDIKTLPQSDVLFLTTDGVPLCGTRSMIDGSLQLKGLSGVSPGDTVIMTSNDGRQSESSLVKLLRV